MPHCLVLNSEFTMTQTAARTQCLADRGQASKHALQVWPSSRSRPSHRSHQPSRRRQQPNRRVGTPSSSRLRRANQLRYTHDAQLPSVQQLSGPPLRAELLRASGKLGCWPAHQPLCELVPDPSQQSITPVYRTRARLPPPRQSAGPCRRSSAQRRRPPRCCLPPPLLRGQLGCCESCVSCTREL